MRQTSPTQCPVWPGPLQLDRVLLGGSSGMNSAVCYLTGQSSCVCYGVGVSEHHSVWVPIECHRAPHCASLFPAQTV